VPALAVGVAFTVIFTVEVTALHGLMPVVVSVSTAIPENAAGGVQVADKVFAFGENVPPAGVDQTPPVAEQPTVPLSVAVPP